jgi:hypothetical protein
VKFNDYRTLFVTVSLVFILISTVPIISRVMPVNTESFFVMRVLGENMMLEQYYPNDNPNIQVGSLVRWHVGVYNYMGSVQYVAVRVKLLNSTLSSPDSDGCVPSGVPAFFEFRHVLVNNETWIFPFYWNISETDYQGNVIIINEIVVNDVALRLDASAVSGSNFRMVFELWVYNDAMHDFEFAWKSGQEDRCVWNQIWFNATLL